MAGQRSMEQEVLKTKAKQETKALQAGQVTRVELETKAGPAEQEAGGAGDPHCGAEDHHS